MQVGTKVEVKYGLASILKHVYDIDRDKRSSDVLYNTCEMILLWANWYKAALKLAMSHRGNSMWSKTQTPDSFLLTSAVNTWRFYISTMGNVNGIG